MSRSDVFQSFDKKMFHRASDDLHRLLNADETFLLNNINVKILFALVISHEQASRTKSAVICVTETVLQQTSDRPIHRKDK